MNSSTEQRLLRGAASHDAVDLAIPELHSGSWSRAGNGAMTGGQEAGQLLGTVADSTRRTARAQGYAVGWAEGRRAAQAAARTAADAAVDQAAADSARRAAEHRDAVAALTDATAQLQARLAEVCRAVDEQATGLALELTRELVGHATADAAEHVLERVTGLLPEHPVVRVRLHPDVAGTAQLPDATVVADPGLGRADAIVEAHTHVLDLRVDSALERLREALA